MGNDAEGDNHLDHPLHRLALLDGKGIGCQSWLLRLFFISFFFLLSQLFQLEPKVNKAVNTAADKVKVDIVRAKSNELGTAWNFGSIFFDLQESLIREHFVLE